MTPNPATMTVQEAMDFAAMRCGWSKATRPIVTHKDDDIHWYYPSQGVVWFKGVDENRSVDEASYYHPLSPTLDSAAAAMPSGWTWQVNDLYWHAFPRAGPKGNKTFARIKRTDDELTDRWRLVVACMLAEKEVGDE